MTTKAALHKFFDLVCGISPRLKRSVWRIFYQYVTGLDKGAQVIFMNYGYASESEKTKLRKIDEKNRYCIQLYHHVASAINLKDKDLLEVGCGRGGGSSYIMRYFNPNSIAGMDFSGKLIKFCKKFYSVKGLSFYVGDAESLPFEDNKFDAVVNVESSHCYGNMNQFLREVFRVIRPDGHFLFADFRKKDEINTLRKQLVHSGFELIKEERITQNVLRALELDNNRKLKLIQKVPRILHKSFSDFAGLKGTETYESFRSGDREYFNFVLKKKNKK